MTIYFLCYLFIVAISCACSALRVGQSCDGTKEKSLKKKRKEGSVFVAITFLLLIALIGLRHPTMGVDLEVYLPAYHEMNTLSWGELFFEPFQNFEVGYRLFNKLMGTILPGEQPFLFVCAFLSLAPMGLLIGKYSENKFFSIICYMGLPIFPILFSTLRQAIAVGFSVLAFCNVKERRPVRFLFWSALACTFHSSAIVCFLFYPAYHIRLSKGWTVFSLCLLPVVYLLRYPIFSVVALIFKEHATPDDNGAVTLFLVFMALYAFAIFFGNLKDKETTGLSNLFWFACVIQAMGGVYMTAIRVGYYFIVYLALLLPKVFSDIGKTVGVGTKYVLTAVLFLCFLAFGLYSLSIGNTSWYESNPYYFFWEEGQKAVLS